jgi:ADP-dependent NAD(P)H-hydrate dehydratase / NAD(P)H-hydrate epimerase
MALLRKSRKGSASHSVPGGEFSVDHGESPSEDELFSGPADVKRVTGPRKAFSSKRDHGYVLVIGGSDVYSGAPGLAALAALRTGAGLAIVAAPESVANVIRSYSPDLIVYSMRGRSISPSHLNSIGKILERVNSVVIGPGIGNHPRTSAAVRSIIGLVKRSKLSMVVDADAIRSLSGHLDIIADAKAVLTPNSGEFKAVGGSEEVGEKWQEKVKPAMSFARKARCTVLLKGHETVITDGTAFRVNRTGNPSMATAGVGDVLSGIVAAYLAQGQRPFEAAVAGAYVHGCVGDLVLQDRGFHATASDLIEKIPEVLRPFDTTA